MAAQKTEQEKIRSCLWTFVGECNFPTGNGKFSSQFELI